jgi:citrate lyase beta subunit
MDTTLRPQDIADILERLTEANQRVTAAYPGDRPDRQPVHTVYGGAQLFSGDVTKKLGATAERLFRDYAPDPATLAAAVGLGGDPAFQKTVHERVASKLAREPIEDFRIDFEDGYGHRLDHEEDGHATQCGEETARAMKDGTLPPWCGIRVKPFSEELRARSLRTLDLYITRLVQSSGGRLPEHFVVTLPKITSPEQVTALAAALEWLEVRLQLPPRSIPIELMVETPLSIFGPDGRVALPELVRAGQGRVRGAHFGTYDYTASCNITAHYQQPQHPACDFARHVMQVSLAGTGVTLSDGATTVLPVPPHREGAEGAPLSADQRAANRATMHRAWKIHYQDVRSSLRHAYYQGWDLHPGQLVTRYAANYAFFLESRAEAGARLKTFVAKSAQATLLGATFDDAATGQGLLNFFLRGLNCGAITEQEATATGLTIAEIQTRSFAKILEGHRRAGG